MSGALSALGLYGGSFDPPHLGHVALARRAKEALSLQRVLVLVSDAPGHKRVETPATARLELVRAAFPDDEVVLDDYPRTVELLRAHPEWRDAVFLIGADQFRDLRSWQEPEEVLRLVRLGVATRPGFPTERLEAVLHGLEGARRAEFFELEPYDLSSRELRARIAAGEDVSAALPAAVWALIRERRLYRSSD